MKDETPTPQTGVARTATDCVPEDATDAQIRHRVWEIRRDRLVTDVENEWQAVREWIAYKSPSSTNEAIFFASNMMRRLGLLRSHLLTEPDGSTNPGGVSSPVGSVSAEGEDSVKKDFARIAAITHQSECPRCFEIRGVAIAHLRVPVSPASVTGEAESAQEWTELPWWTDCEAKVDAKTATPIEQFIYDNEPGMAEDANQFRSGLLAALNFAAHNATLHNSGDNR